MATEEKPDRLNWNESDEDTDSDESDSSNDSKSEKSEEDHHEEKKQRADYGNYNNYGGKNNYNNNYKHNKGGYGKKPMHSFKRGNPEGNYEKYYKNDPNFFVGVIKQEEGPHELSVKIAKKDHYHDRYSQAPDLSIDEIKEILNEFGVKDAKPSFSRDGGIRINITIEDSEECIKIYSDLYDNLRKKIPGFFTQVFYQRDIEILEKYADEEADKYYKNQKEKVKQKIDGEYNNYNKPYNQRDRRDHYEHRNNDHRKHGRDHKYNKYDHKNRRNEDDTTSTHSFSGFGKKGPTRFFNSKKESGLKNELSKATTKKESSDKDTESAVKKAEVSKEAEIINTATEKPSPAESESKPKDSEMEKKPLKMKRRDTDNDFEIGDLGSSSKQEETKKETEYDKDNQEWPSKTSEVEIKPRNFQRGKRGQRKARGPYRTRFAMLEAHLGLNDSSSEKDDEEEKSKPTLIGDRPETEKFGKDAENKGFNQRSHRGGYRGYGRGYKRGYNNDTYSNHGTHSQRGGRGRGYNQRGRIHRGRGRGRGRGYNQRGRPDARTNYEERSQYSDRFDMESTNSRKSRRGRY